MTDDREALPPRVIPCLLLDDGVMVKTVRYADPTYVGDPVNVINLFNQFEVDEICLLDIGATPRGTGPDLELIERLASECWVPLAYGGGITSEAQIRTILSLGIEKVVLGTAAFETPDLVAAASATFGAQAVVVSVDVDDRSGGRPVLVRGGRTRTGLDAIAYARRAVELGAGELLLNAIHRDGTMSGFDLDLVAAIAHSVDIPVIACGGAGTRDQLRDPIRVGAAAVAAGSLFVFRGPNRAVLVNFPERARIEALFRTDG